MSCSNNHLILQYNQNGLSYLSLVLPFEIVDAISEVLVYGKHPDGYQRNPNKVHYNKIKKEALTNPDLRLPTSIILGVDEQTIKPLIGKDKNGYDYITIDPSQRKFRIVDGQHRIRGLREAAIEKNVLLKFPLSVLIIVSAENRRSVELEVFTDINSKTKRINTDLAELAKYDYQIKEKRIEENKIGMHIAIKTAYYLKDEGEINVWLNAIKFDIHAEVTLGIIGVKIFCESISGIVEKYMSENSYKKDGKLLEGEALIEYCKKSSTEIGKFLFKVWNEVIRVKWERAFKEDIVKNDEGEVVKIFYDKDYYLQKGLGIKSINPIIGEKVKQLGFGDIAFSEIQKVIFESKVKIADWKTGGPFSGFNSEAGFNKIKQMVQNNITIPQ